MRLAYSISGYKLPRQFAWLMAAIRHPDDLYVVHVDGRTPTATFAAMREVAGDAANVVFIERQPIAWMGISLVEAEMRAIAAAMAARPAFDYLISLSMQDYPLQSRQTIVAELEAAPGRDYVTFERLRDMPFHMRRRPALLSFERNGRLVKTVIPRWIPRDLKLAWKGPWWRILSHRTCEWLLATPLTRRYLDFLRHTQTPDEFLFQNLLRQSPFADRLADGNRHFVAWSGASASPETLTMAMADQLLASPMWFARKFDESVDAAVLHLLARHIGAPLPAHAAESPAINPEPATAAAE
jgi:hypothetical protein